MQRNISTFAPFSIPGTPIEAMPESDQLLHWTSTNRTVCDPSRNISRVLVILNRVFANKTRQAIRQTYGRLSATETPNLKHWTKLFLAGKPRSANETKMILEENKVFGDVVVANVEERYYHNPTLKILIAFKFVSCYCPHVEYFVKCDDDVYFDVSNLDAKIKLQEKKFGKFMLHRNITRSARLYLGETNDRKVSRGGKWGVSLQDYRFPKYPPHMRGGLIVLSMSAVHQMALDCPYTCIGLDPKEYLRNIGEKCFWAFEDVFIGSCVVFTQKTAHFGSFIEISKWRSLPDFIVNYKKSKPKAVYLHNLRDTNFKEVEFFKMNIDKLIIGKR